MEKNNEMKESLKKLLCKVKCKGDDFYHGGCMLRYNEQCEKIYKLESCMINSIAEHLIENNVVVIPCQIGDKVYMPWKWYGNSGIAELTVEKITIKYNRLIIQTNFRSDDLDYFIIYNLGIFEFEDIGKKIFLTFDEAQNSLIEGKYV